VGVIIVNGGREVNNEIDFDDYESAGDGGAEEFVTSSVEIGDEGDMRYSSGSVSMSEILRVCIVVRASGEFSVVWIMWRWSAWAWMSSNSDWERNLFTRWICFSSSANISAARVT